MLTQSSYFMLVQSEHGQYVVCTPKLKIGKEQYFYIKKKKSCKGHIDGECVELQIVEDLKAKA